MVGRFPRLPARDADFGVNLRGAAAVLGVAVLLGGGIAAGAVASPLRGNQTSTDPAPDPDPPSGAVPDPYTAPSKPVRKVARHVYSAPRVYSQPHVYSHERRALPLSTSRVPRSSQSRRHIVRNRRARTHAAVRRHRPLQVRITPAAAAYVAAVAMNASAKVVPTTDSGGVARRRAAALVLIALVAASLNLLLLVSRMARTRAPS